jgi:hypothetical protein
MSRAGNDPAKAIFIVKLHIWLAIIAPAVQHPGVAAVDQLHAR